MKRIIKKILLEEYKKKNKTKDEIAIALSNKAMQHFINGLRFIESALQYAENEDIIKTLDEVRLSLLSNEGRQEGFAAQHNDKYDNTIDVLGTMIDDHSVDNYNFNLNGKGPKAPEGEF